MCRFLYGHTPIHLWSCNSRTSAESASSWSLDYSMTNDLSDIDGQSGLSTSPPLIDFNIWSTDSQRGRPGHTL